MRQTKGASINLFQFNILMLVLRLTVAGFMLSHGWPKLEKLIAGGEIEFIELFGMSATITLALTVFAEVVCSIFIALGLISRIASLILGFTMAVAAFYVHADDPFGNKEKALLYLMLYLVIWTLGPGKLSVEKLISRK